MDSRSFWFDSSCLLSISTTIDPTYNRLQCDLIGLYLYSHDNKKTEKPCVFWKIAPFLTNE